MCRDYPLKTVQLDYGARKCDIERKHRKEMYKYCEINISINRAGYPRL